MRKKGSRKTPGSGRKKGVQNKRTLDMPKAEEIAARLGCDPFEILINFAKGDWESLGYPNECKVYETADGDEREGAPYITPDMRIAAAKEAAQYLMPKRRATEITVKSELEVEAEKFSNLPPEKQAELLEQQAKKLRGEL